METDRLLCSVLALRGGGIDASLEELGVMERVTLGPEPGHLSVESKCSIAQHLQNAPKGGLIGSGRGLLNPEIISSAIVEPTNALSPRQSKSKNM